MTAEMADRFRNVEQLQVPEVGRVAVIDRTPGLQLVDPRGVEWEPATSWLLQLVADDRSVHTVRAYAMSLLRFLRFLWAVDHPWDKATEVEARDFVLWARSAKKFAGRKREAAPRTSFNPVTGKRYQTDRYSAATINHTLSATREFFTFQVERGRGPLLNPIPDGRGRSYAHHDPAEPFPHRRRGRLRQKEPIRVPRSMPDHLFDEFFRRLSCNRDRALVAFYVSSGCRASELLGLTGDRVNYGDQQIAVVRKGGVLQWLPASPDAFVWLRLYQLERGTPRPGQPVWLTLREPYEPLRYDALRAVIDRANRLLGSNWTAHDLRHTFTVRALNGGVPLHEVQEILGHASLATTSVYSKPHLEEIVAHHRAVFGESRPTTTVPAPGYNENDLDVLFGRTWR